MHLRNYMLTHEVYFSGEEEVKQGKPFVGPSGRLLDQLLMEIGVDSDRDTYITNIAKRCPLQSKAFGNIQRLRPREPSQNEIAHYMPILKKVMSLTFAVDRGDPRSMLSSSHVSAILQELSIVRPVIVLLWGRIATQTILKDNRPISVQRGQWRRLENDVRSIRTEWSIACGSQRTSLWNLLYCRTCFHPQSASCLYFTQHTSFETSQDASWRSSRVIYSKLERSWVN